MLRKLAIITAATTLATVGSVAAMATNADSDLFFTSGLTSFEGGTINFCNYGADSLGASFTSNDGHLIKVSYMAKKGNVVLEGPVGATGTITDGKVDDRGTFLLKGILADNNAGKTADFVFSGNCGRTETPAPEAPAPAPTDLFTMTTGSGKLNLTGDRTDNCSFSNDSLSGRFFSNEGHLLDIAMVDGNGNISVKTPNTKYDGVITKGHVDETGSFTTTGMIDIDGTIDTFVLAGKCVKN